MIQKTIIGNAFSSPRDDAFPAGLRVLVVDDDLTWLTILEKMLKKCSYEVTTCGLARDALNLLRERKDKYDIVISDVNMPDMDGFKLLEHVGLEMDLPVIMMSVDGETSRVMKGVQHGACDYLLKPIRMKELRNIWQHVLRKKIHEVRDIEILEGIESLRIPRIGLEHFEDGHILCADDPTLVKKRKDVENRHDDKDIESPSTKKARVVWSVDLHQKFVKAVNQIGFDKVGPKKILDLMNVPWLTRENVASHLQKYRLYLSRLQKENDMKTSVGGMKHSDSPLIDFAGSPSNQNSINMLKGDASNGGRGFSGNSIFIQNSELSSHESEIEVIVSKNTEKRRRSLIVDVPHHRKPRNPQMGHCHPFMLPRSEGTLQVFESNLPLQYSLCEIPQLQMKQEAKSLHSIDGFRQPPKPDQQNRIQADYQLSVPAIISESSIAERATGRPVSVKPLNDGFRNNVNHVSSTGSALDSIHDQTKSYEPNHRLLESIPTSKSGIKNHGLDPNCLSNLESAERSANHGVSSLATLDYDNQVSWVQGDCYAMNVGLQTCEFPEEYGPELIADIPAYLYDVVRLDCEGSRYDSTEYSPIEQGLYI